MLKYLILLALVLIPVTAQAQYNCACSCPNVSDPANMTGCACSCSALDASVSDADPVDLGPPDAGVWPDASPPDTGVVVGSAGCGIPHATGNQTVTLTVNGQPRSMLVSTPTGYNPNVVHWYIDVLHGCQWSGPSMQNAFFQESAAGGRAVFAYPSGLLDSGCPGAPYNYGWDLSPTGRDVAFFDARLQWMLDNYCIDLKTVGVFGRSRGAYMANVIAAHRPGVVASVAVLSGALTTTPTGPVPMMIYHAQDDATVPFSNGTSAREVWRVADSCSATTTSTAPAPCVLYGCPAPLALEWCAPPTGGHWPLSWAGPEGLEFILAHPKP